MALACNVITWCMYVMPTKTKHPRPRNSNRATAIDPRLARVHALLEASHPHYQPGGVGGEQFPEVLRRLLDCVPNWGLINIEPIQAMIAAIVAPSDDPDCLAQNGLNDDLSKMLDAMAKVADDEHRDICACCRKNDAAAEFRALVMEIQARDPKALRSMLKTARRAVAK